MRCIEIGFAALAIFATSAAAQQGAVPPNQIMPRLPPLPEPTSPRPSAAPCKLSADLIPKGDTKPATRAEQTPNGIGLYGGEGPSDDQQAEKSPPCPRPG